MSVERRPPGVEPRPVLGFVATALFAGPPIAVFASIPVDAFLDALQGQVPTILQAITISIEELFSRSGPAQGVLIGVLVIVTGIVMAYPTALWPTFGAVLLAGLVWRLFGGLNLALMAICGGAAAWFWWALILSGEAPDGLIDHVEGIKFGLSGLLAGAIVWRLWLEKRFAVMQGT